MDVRALAARSGFLTAITIIALTAISGFGGVLMAWGDHQLAKRAIEAGQWDAAATLHLSAAITLSAGLAIASFGSALAGVLHWLTWKSRLDRPSDGPGPWGR
jgi:hypothetical protein